MAENHSNGRTLPSLRGKENKLQGITTIVESQSSDSLSPWERARERAKQSNPPDTPRSLRRKVVAWASPTKNRKPSYHLPSFLQMLLPVGEETNGRESKQWSDFSYLFPLPAGEG